MTTEPSTARPFRRPLLPRVLRLAALGSFLAGSFGISAYLRPSSAKAAKALAVETHEGPADPPDRLIDRLIRNEQFAEALALCQSGGTPPEEPWIRYRVAVCQESLERWKDAAEIYDGLTAKASADVWVNATLGVARCRLALGDLAEAEAAVQEVERLGGSVPPAAGHERTRLRACVEYSRLGVPASPDPFDIKALAWPTAVDRRSDQTLWLPPPPPSAEPHDQHEPQHKTEPIAVPPPVPPAEASRDRVRHSLQKVLEHDDHPAVRLTLANFDAQDGAWTKALPVYRRLIEDEPESPEAKLAAYNLGLGLLKDGHTAAAREAFLGTLDRDPRGKWGELARYWVGRTFLDGGDPTAALRPLREASAATARPVRAAAALALVVCQLLRQKEDAAEREIRGLRPEASASAGAMSDLFANLLRYRTTPSALRAEQVAEGLHQAHELRDLGPAGVALAGQLFQEIGDSSHMAGLYDATAADYRGPWAVQMTLAAADYWNSQGRRAAARSRYLAVAAIDPAGLGRRAEVKLAELDLQDGNGGECLTRCLRLWKQGPADPDHLLRLMGRGFELTGRHAQAAACYSGREPTFE